MADEQETEQITEESQETENTTETTEPDEDAGNEADQEPETFAREYVEKLRQENQRYRERGKRADDYAQRLHTELVRATGRLADPSDLAFDEAHLDDPAALAVAVDELLAKKPHLAARRPIGDIGQGATSSAEGAVDLAGILRARA